jgi:hypothetical protein
LYFKRITVSHKASSHQVFHSFYEEMGRILSPISTTTRNLFLEQIAEPMAQSLKITSCYVCEGTNMGDRWPWEARELDPHEPYNETRYPHWPLRFGFSKPQLSETFVLPNEEDNLAFPLEA